MKRALFLSLCIHGLILLATYWAPTGNNYEDISKNIEIEVIPISRQKKMEAQVVRQVTLPAKLLEELHNPKARFLSLETQRVQQEVQASLKGLSQNQSTSSTTKQKTEQKKIEKLSDYSPDGISAKNELKNLSRNLSTVGETLPTDVKFGSFTALNTNKFQFYSFYSRIEELVRFRWESKIEQAINQFDRKFVLDVIGRKRWGTQIEFWLKPNGEFHSAHIYQESGQKKFDEAAIFAFSNARKFPNPPPEMVEADGFIHLLYNFNVDFNPSPMVQR